jgi:hypothetical protein
MENSKEVSEAACNGDKAKKNHVDTTERKEEGAMRHLLIPCSKDCSSIDPFHRHGNERRIFIKNVGSLE